MSEELINSEQVPTPQEAQKVGAEAVAGSGLIDGLPQFIVDNMSPEERAARDERLTAVDEAENNRGKPVPIDNPGPKTLRDAIGSPYKAISDQRLVPRDIEVRR